MSLENIFEGAQQIYINCSIAAYCIALVPSIISGRAWKNQHPNKLSFTWGYFICYERMIFSVLSTICFIIYARLLVSSGMQLYYDEGLDYSTLSSGHLYMMLGIKFFLDVVFFVIAYNAAVKRNRLCFLLFTICSGNIVYWVVNFAYLGNRWDELAPARDVSEQEITVSTKYSYNLDDIHDFANDVGGAYSDVGGAYNGEGTVTRH